jgi:hypothetical protein
VGSDDPASLIHEPLGLPGSGRVRYGAAMTLYQADRLGPAALEVYRELAAHDRRDPVPVLAERGLPPPPAPKAGAALARLFHLSAAYVKGCSHEGRQDVAVGLARAQRHPAPPGPAAHPVADRWLATALAAMGATHLPLADSIAKAAPFLSWRSHGDDPTDEIGQSFRGDRALALILGDSAPYQTVDFDLGLVLIAPHVLCRDHAHAAPELCAPLTGPHGWRFDPGSALEVRPADVPVWNPPHRSHLTKVGAVPFLGLFVRTCEVAVPAQVLPADDWAELEALRLG